MYRQDNKNMKEHHPSRYDAKTALHGQPPFWKRGLEIMNPVPSVRWNFILIAAFIGWVIIVIADWIINIINPFVPLD